MRIYLSIPFGSYLYLLNYYENNIMQESEKRVLQEYDYHYRNQ